ncbi:hypothetical protein [Aggregatibacter actinomycetemcomitans]|uniref:hypothetical protein n=1 Tax=Aggregatibacter actinomycetemcomitans TaxID=714 RepID=UPI00022AE09A|nr:hypothetical protein [Aggregatibacter actinomycetemcomitans]KOE63908.1 hypothetical protein SCC393_0311150 [Aggregatibacter actinomycetemcomitans serotype e str. SCC393]KOE67400.1 hypothetical protein A160_0201895 [Aggregatibacter actinomycetemcomitans serotype e str. A160]KYK78347.1 hypothetical protein SA2876_04230 [Aggregatibacter actinomycetemcomitans serotype e str. SA2876]
MKNPIEKFLIYLLKKPRVSAVLKEIIRGRADSKIDTAESRETLIGKLVNDALLYRQVMDDLRKNPYIPSPYHKFPAELYRAALRLNYVLKNPERHIAPLTQEPAAPVELADFQDQAAVL